MAGHQIGYYESVTRFYKTRKEKQSSWLQLVRDLLTRLFFALTGINDAVAVLGRFQPCVSY